jgi:hypothetical protein
MCEEEKACTAFWCGNLKERNHLEDLGVDGRIILKYIFREWVGGHGLDCFSLGYGQLVGCCECSNESPGFIKCGEFIDCLRNCLLSRRTHGVSELVS